MMRTIDDYYRLLIESRYHLHAAGCDTFGFSDFGNVTAVGLPAIGLSDDGLAGSVACEPGASAGHGGDALTRGVVDLGGGLVFDHARTPRRLCSVIVYDALTAPAAYIGKPGCVARPRPHDCFTDDLSGFGSRHHRNILIETFAFLPRVGYWPHDEHSGPATGIHVAPRV